jgi:myo-inositol-1(or 4)-monophosphatase
MRLIVRGRFGGTMSDLLEVALRAAHAAGTLLAERAGSPGVTGTKSSNVDMVTEIDIAAGVVVAREIAAGDPGTPFLVEEPEVYALAGVEEAGLDAPAVWVVDPIDGTTSFIHGYPTFSVSIARLERGAPVLGVVYNVPMDETFAARAGAGATRNGASISASDADSIDRSLVVTGFPYDRGAPLTRQLAVLGTLLRTVHGIRRDGSAAVDCCHVACGRADAFWEFGLRPWDTSAGMLIAREAGATISALDGSSWAPGTSDVLVAAPRLHPVLLAAIREADPGPL